MSVAMLSSVSASFYQMAGALPVSATAATSPPPTAAVKPADHDDDDRSHFRKNTLVNAMMAAFQALGIGQSAANTATGTATPAASTTTAAAVITSTPAETSAAPAAGTTPNTTATTSTDAAPAADTLEKAVNEFAHALFSMLHRQGRSGQAEGEHEGEHAHNHQGLRSGGYNSFVQRLEKLAQSLGATPAAAVSGTSAASVDTTVLPVAQTTVASGASATPNAVPSTDTTSAVPSRGVTRLLAAFSKVLSLLQPPLTATVTPTTPATTTTSTAAGTATSAADKLKLFLTSLAQSLQSGAGATPASPVGSRVNVTA